MPRCFFKGCTDLNKDTKHLSNVYLFSVPKEDYFFEQWKQIVSFSDKALTKKDRICSLHFNENDIERCFETKMPDGSVWSMERNRKRLKDGAVPSRCLQHCSRNRKNSEEVSVSNTDDPELIISHSFNFDILKAVKDEIADGKWTVTTGDKFIGFLFWNLQFLISKHVLIFDDMKIKVFFNGIETNLFARKEIDSMSTLSAILRKIGDMKLCEGSNKKHFCKGYISKQSENLCQFCIKSLQRKKDAASKLSLRKTQIVKRRKQILRKKISLEKKVEYLQNVVNAQVGEQVVMKYLNVPESAKEKEQLT